MTSFFSPLDMLDMQDIEQDILRCLNRQPGLAIAEIAAKIDTSEEELEATLREMLNRSQIIEQLKDGRRVFSVRFSRQESRSAQLPSGLLDLFDEQADTFLEEVFLTALLTPKQREALLAKSISRQLVPNEVFVWQGDSFKQLGIVRVGLLKKSRLQSSQAKKSLEYIGRAEWFGLQEVFSDYPSLDTYTAVTESELLLWENADFMASLQKHSQFSIAINRVLSQRLHHYQNRMVHGTGHLWVIGSVEQNAGATTLATNLAVLARLSHKDTPPRVLLWNAYDDGHKMLSMLGMNPRIGATALPGQNALVTHESGLDVLLKTEMGAYPPQVQIDILLADLQSQYDYIICDTGCQTENELLLRLRGLGAPLITLTSDNNGVEKGYELWNELQQYAQPAQKRFMILNQTEPVAEVDAAFNIILPHDPESIVAAKEAGQPLVMAVAASPLVATFEEIFRRLSLNHVIGIFVPSTLDIDQEFDNKAQVQETLSFLGGVFGGATSTDAEGVWQSEKDGLVAEQVTLVRTFVSQQALEEHLDDVVEFASNLKKSMRQEAVAIDVDNQLMLV